MDPAQDNALSTRLLTIQQAANLLGVTPMTLRRWEKAGNLIPTRTLGNQRRYTKEQLEYFQTKRNIEKINQETVSQTPQAPVQTPLTTTQSEKLNLISSVLEQEDEEIHELFGFRRKALVVTFFGILISFVLVSGLTFAFLERPQQTSEFMGYKDASGNK
ncbi:MAG: MerR family transcriptional regulator, partial [Candidatus Levybacteria bacterium]|nr:MerR family transcriptional regulator [Candidatus Levybacteria bacterium]